MTLLRVPGSTDRLGESGRLSYSLSMKLTVRPLTPDLWPALVDLFGEKGACNGCWCMYWRIGNAYRRAAPEENKAAFEKVVKHGPPPGLPAFKGKVPIAWCLLTPRDTLAWLDRSWARVNDVPVWSISCFYVRKGYRRQGVTAGLLKEAMKTAKRNGAQVLEAYPLDADRSPSASGTGYVTTFKNAGFTIVSRRSPARPIMSYDLRPLRRNVPA